MFAGIARLAKDRWGSLWWVAVLLLLVGMVTNFGTAALRLPALVSSPQTIDGASYYVGAWAMRLGLSPYVWTPEILRLAGEAHGVMVVPTPPASPTPWVWMFQMLTVFSFPVAAWVWLLILLAVVVYSTHLLVRVAGYSGWRSTLIALPFMLTFGPTVLNLTIGQNALFALLGALALGLSLRSNGRPHGAVGVWLVAVSAKIYPVLWVAVLPFLRKWRMSVAMVVTCVLLFGIISLLEPDADHDYWFDYLLKRGREVTGDIFIDDQSLSARVELLGRTNRIGLHGLDAGSREERIWSPPWEVSERALRILSFILIIGLGAVVVWTWLHAGRVRHKEGLLYLLVLYSLLPIPHMERYNHVLLLPAMAWLWRQGPKYRLLAVLAYCLAGLSRLNHLWASLLSWPLGPLATGTCMYAVLILGAGIIHVVLAPREPEVERY